MDVSTQPTFTGDQWAEQVAQVLHIQRERVREFLAAQQTRLRHAETELRRQCEQAVAGLMETPQAAPASVADDGLQERYETAMEEIRSLESHNAELQRDLAASQAAGPTARLADGGMDWEAKKLQILASLESDDGLEGEEAAERRSSTEAVVFATEQIVADKDRQIAALQKQLAAEQLDAKQPVPDSEPETAALRDAAAILGADDVIRQERENLARLKTEWEEKLRHAEIELSLERAKIARQRAEIAEKQRAFDQQNSDEGEKTPSGKPTRGRWLARLGLKDPNEK